MGDAGAVAAVPGHVTGFFAAHPDPDPRVAGSTGAGVTLTDGVRVRVTPGERGCTLDGRPTEITAVDRVLDALDATAGVRIESDLPVGAGFGVSGAAALGTALAANAALGAGRSENELVATAHAAEVRAGTGLGDVVAQARGRLPVRLAPGAPGHGRLDGVPVGPEARVEYLVFGGLSTERVLADGTERLCRAGATALSTLRADPTPARLLALSRRFAAETGLMTDRVARVVEAVETDGGRASMAMLGDAVFAFGTALSDAGYEPGVCRIDRSGARLVAGDAAPVDAGAADGHA